MTAPRAPNSSRAEDRVSIPIDAVYAWVDGADPAHRPKRARYRQDAETTAERWRDNGELR